MNMNNNNGLVKTSRMNTKVETSTRTKRTKKRNTTTNMSNSTMRRRKRGTNGWRNSRWWRWGIWTLELTKLKAMRTKNICTSIIIYGSGSGYHKKNYLFFARSVPRGKGGFFFMKWELVVIGFYIYPAWNPEKNRRCLKEQPQTGVYLLTYHIRYQSSYLPNNLVR